MDESRLNRVMSRIESALNRVEKAAARPATAQAGADPVRHDLEERVRGALAGLDALIESLQT